MKRTVSKAYPWFTRISFNFEKVKAGHVAAYCDGHVIVDARRGWHGNIYVEPGFHAVELEDDEYSNLSVAAYEDGIGAIGVYPLDESTPEEWALAKQLLAGTIQRIPTQEELEDEEDWYALEIEAKLTGIRYRQ